MCDGPGWIYYNTNPTDVRHIMRRHNYASAEQSSAFSAQFNIFYRDI